MDTNPKPFFARFITNQAPSADAVGTKVKAGRFYSTTKYPSDIDEVQTMKYPSDADDDL